MTFPGRTRTVLPVSRAGKPRILYLNGIRFRRALIAGAKQLIENRDHLNEINVFPVADGDTGTNMAGTLGFIVDGIAPSRERAIDRMLRAIADLALSGAQGCSGTILAQFLHGLAQELTDAARVTTTSFGLGVRKAVRYPWEAVSEPKEGTILTVLQDWGDTVYEWSRRTDDFAELLSRAYRAAKQSLQRTREQLEILSRAGVVDAGAQGLVHMLAGITRFIARGRLREVDNPFAAGQREAEVPSEVVEHPSYRFCTQFVVEGSGIDVGALRGELAGLGDSLIVAGSAAKAKIHIHSDSPEQVFRRVDRRGTVTNQRIEDMAAQYRAAHTPHRDIAFVVDSSCDLPPETWERHAIHMVPIIVRLNGRTYLDKYTITPEILFSLLHDGTRAHPSTSQPAPSDFRGRYEFLLRHYSSVISLSIPAGLSGTFDAARLGARMAGGDVTVIDSKTTSIGLGLLTRRAAEAVERGATKEETVALVERLIRRVRIHLTVPSLDALMRSGRVGRARGFAANLLNLTPLIQLNAETNGKPVQGPTVFGVREGRRKILQLMEREIDHRLPTEFAIAHANAYEHAAWFKERIMKTFTLATEPFIVEATTVLAAHIGEGAVGVSYILPEG
jgi:DegV family protein with EDD domain